jgi:AcrR family transcriptional regulator
MLAANFPLAQPGSCATIEHSFNLVRVSAAGVDAPVPEGTGGEYGTPDRIRDAAIARFGRDGFGASLRAIAADAEVTAGLVVHHFGSKDGLRRACDEHVLAVVRAQKSAATTTGSAAVLVAQLAEVEKFAPLAQYLLRSLQAGGELAGALVDHLVADAQEYLAEGVAAGVVLPSRDPEGRARFLAYQALGAMLVWAATQPGHDAASFSTGIRAYLDQVAVPAIELFSQGLFTNRAMLDEYLMYVPDPPGGDAPNSDSDDASAS